MTSFRALATAILVAHCNAKTSLSQQLRSRRLSFDRIAGYEPDSQVTDHNAIDLDQAAIMNQLDLGTEAAFDVAQEIYEKGGNSKSYAQLTLTEPLTAPIAKGTIITGLDSSDQAVTGKAYTDAAVNDSILEVQYKTLDNQMNYVNCQVGALSLAGEGATNKDGCEC